jgi:hypothetical protein
MRNVQKPRNPSMINPDSMHLISEIPEPAAYFAKDRTRLEATKENAAFKRRWYQHISLGERGREERKPTAKSTYMNQRASDTLLQKCHDSQALSSSPSSSQQQNCWFNHQPSEQ